jgi:hypothetical protein
MFRPLYRRRKIPWTSLQMRLSACQNLSGRCAEVKDIASTRTRTSVSPWVQPVAGRYADCAVTVPNLSLLKVWKEILLAVLIESLLLYWPQHSQVWGVVTTCVPRQRRVNFSVFFLCNTVIFTSTKACTHKFSFSIYVLSGHRVWNYGVVLVNLAYQ